MMDDSNSEKMVDIIRLNVGGFRYTARRESLCRFKDSMLAAMFSGRFPLKMDNSGACLIDRDGSLFKYLLNYLHGEVCLPENEETRIALQEEADYFGIPYPYSLVDHLANEMETYCLRTNIELKKALIGFCDSYGLICTKPTVWVLHYLNTSGASCESRVIGIYATKAGGTTAVEKELGERINSKNIYKREAGNNIQYIWSYYSATELKKIMDAFEAWEGRGASYWRVPQELIECWTLEEHSLKGSLQNMSPVRKRRIVDPFDEEESQLNNRIVRKPVQFSGPSTSTCIKVKNSASLKMAASSHPQTVLKSPSRDTLTSKVISKTVYAKTIPLTKNSQASLRNADSGVVGKMISKSPLSRKSATSRVIKLKRTPLCNELLTQHSSSVMKKVKQPIPSAAVAATSASHPLNCERLGLSLKCTSIRDGLQNKQLSGDI
ncbi:BTB/POZ domain-containing protein KCTD18 [Python bivittatus]|uniref:BTB/POZ domain-containing protein KCTD18 n=1 Tax=Python bivittatus TaxID=176946 RepID=A0A9F2WHZ3_PYTBI|nr:BTB/POZ domain-containing protein KCTD18 [Python bivittatus]XP_025028386.1 BTB/POZ domain-containing protein KCTD18 [Python bivittatus]XP_025028387.1 BTB/POZ domain-containing protein KCTD18 [Python bivittatus]